MAPTKLLVSNDGFTEVMDRPVTVVSYWPLAPDAPMPPGVSRWPRPGEALASPTLIHDLAVTNQLQLFGHLAGIITVEGLETPTERRVYLVPTDAALSTATMTPVAGFNELGNWSIGPGVGYLNASEPKLVRTLLVGTLLIPAVVALVIGASLDGDARRRRVQLLDALGASRTHRLVVDSAEAVRPVAIGTLVGAVALAATMVVDVPLRVVDARLLAADARHVWPMLLAVMATGPLVAYAVILLSRSNWRPPRGAYSFSRAQTSPCVGWLAFGGLALVVWVGPQMHEPPQRLLVYFSGLLVVAATLPGLLGMLCAAIAAVAVRSRAASLLVGGRLLASAPRHTARLTVGPES